MNECLPLGSKTRSQRTFNAHFWRALFAGSRWSSSVYLHSTARTMGLDRQRDRSVERSETEEGTLNKGNPDRQRDKKKNTVEQSKNTRTNQQTKQRSGRRRWNVNCCCFSCPARRADAMVTARFGKPRCDWLWRKRCGLSFTAWRFCRQKKTKRRERKKTEFLSDSNKLNIVCLDSVCRWSGI